VTTIVGISIELLHGKREMSEHWKFMSLTLASSGLLHHYLKSPIGGPHTIIWSPPWSCALRHSKCIHAPPFSDPPHIHLYVQDIDIIDKSETHQAVVNKS
jgi:hypothetical protein